MFCWPCISIHLCNKTNLTHCLSSVYFANQPLHVSGIFVAHHQEVYCIYMYIYTLYIYSNWYVLCFLVGMSVSRVGMEPPYDGLQICPKHVEVDWRNKLKINSASSWFALQGCYSVVISGGTHRQRSCGKYTRYSNWKQKKEEKTYTLILTYLLTYSLHGAESLLSS